MAASGLFVDTTRAACDDQVRHRASQDIRCGWIAVSASACIPEYSCLWKLLQSNGASSGLAQYGVVFHERIAVETRVKPKGRCGIVSWGYP